MQTWACTNTVLDEMTMRPLTRLDANIPVTIDGCSGGWTQHLSLESMAIDGAGALGIGSRVEMILQARDDFLVPLTGTVRSVETGPVGPRVSVVFDALDPQGSEGLTALLSGLRKSAHLSICATQDVEADRIDSGFDAWRFPHVSLPEIDAGEIDVRTEFLGKEFAAPILISGMTGGSLPARDINRSLATAAQELGIGMGLGSQRAMLEDLSLRSTYEVRDVAPDILLLANLGAVQLGRGLGVEACSEVVESVGADALVLHLNPLQEMVQPEGDRNWKGILDRIATICEELAVPVVLKETGAGMGGKMGSIAESVGAAALDVGGAGGTSWGYIEGFRSEDSVRRQIGETFRNWGISTYDSVRALRETTAIPLVASGGVRSGLEVAKAIAIGATVCGSALPFFRAVREEGVQGVCALTNRWVEELKIAMMCTGSGDLTALGRVPLTRSKS